MARCRASSKAHAQAVNATDLPPPLGPLMIKISRRLEGHVDRHHAPNPARRSAGGRSAWSSMPRAHGNEEATFQGSFLNGFRKRSASSVFNERWDDRICRLIHRRALEAWEGVFFARGYYKYDGDWKLDKRDGKGKFSYDNGAGEYEGSWKDDMRHGKGIMFIPNEYEYDGEWKEDREEGKGTAKYLKQTRNTSACLKRGSRVAMESVYIAMGASTKANLKVAEILHSRLRTKETDRNTEASGKAIRKTGTVRVNLAMELFSEASGKMIRGCNRPRVLRIRKSGVSSLYPPWLGTNATFGIEARDELNNKRLSEGIFFAWC